MNQEAVSLLFAYLVCWIAGIMTGIKLKMIVEYYLKLKELRTS